MKIYGQNYETKKYSLYFTEYESCEPGYAALAKTSGKVQFAKGANSASTSVPLKNKDDFKAFWLNMRKGQTVSVEAFGCGISF